MRVIFLAFFVTVTAFSQSNPQIEVIPNPKTIEDFDHQYKGCLENSECDQVMGLQLTRWKDLISKITDPKFDSNKKAQYLELFRAKYGIPVEFYTNQKSQQGFKPLLFNSSCKEHNPKEGLKVLRGTSFVKSLSREKATIWRDQTQIEIPVGELLYPQPVYLYGAATPTLFHLPIGDQPLFVKNKDLYVLREDDGFFYMLRVSQNGDWKIENFDMTKLSEFEERRSEVKCPDKSKLAPKVFGVEFCKSIWDDDQKKPVVVKLHQGCII